MNAFILIDSELNILSSHLISKTFKSQLKHCSFFISLKEDLNNEETTFPFSRDYSFDGNKYRLEISKEENEYCITFNELEQENMDRQNDLEKYKLIVEAANDVIYETNAKGEFTLVNPKTLEITGYEEHELLGRSYLVLIDTDSREEVDQFYRDQLNKQKISSYKEIPIRTKKGKTIWVGLNVQLLQNDIEVQGFIGVGRDITDSYFNRLELKNSEEKYRGIIQNLQYGLMEVDPDERVVYANDNMTQLTGYSLKELVGKKASEVLLNEEARKIIAEEHKKRNKGKNSAYEVPLIRKDGSTRWALISGAPIWNVDGSMRGSIGIHVDITERREAEEELKETRTKLNRYKNGLAALNSVTSNLSLSLKDQITQGLEIANNYLGQELAIVSEVRGNDYEVLYFHSRNDQFQLNRGDIFEVENTMCEVVLRTHDQLAIKDITKSSFNNHPCHDKFGIESYLGIHYRVNDEIRGTVNFSAAKPREEEFDTYDLEFADLFAKWIGFILSISENRRRLENEQVKLALQNKELEKNQKYLSAINDFVTNLLEDESINDIAWEIAENVIDKFGYDDCVIYIFNEDRTQLDQIAAYGPKQDKNRNIVDKISISLGQGIVGSVAESGVAEIVPDTSKDKRYLVDDAYRLSEISVPIIADGEVIGVIDSEHKEKNYFQKEHLDTLTTIANLAANRLKNAMAEKEKLKAQKDLVESEQKLRTILHSAIDAVITINQRGIVTEWNKQAEVIFGYQAEEAIGKLLTDTIIPPQHHQSHDQGMAHFNSTGEGPVLNQKIEITALRKNGEEFPIEMSIIPVESKGEHFFTAFLSDITIQKHVQEEQEKALNRERELNELKSRFVSMTSHEFRTPLTTIKQNTDLISYQLEMDLAAEDFQRYDKYIGRIESDLTRVTSLMNDILMLGRIEAGRIEIDKKETDVVQFIERMVKKYSESDVQGRTIKFGVSGVPRKVQVDKVLMDHMVSNLITNALKYSKEGTTPEVNVVFTDLKKFRIHVKDEGIGIPEKDLKGLFESFYRATNVKNIQGSGLGLSIVKEFTEMHGGTIEVQSEENVGSEFILSLPFE